ncbi:MAG: hypothetical protein RRC07_08620 [Anaerolineae bacterium]|nr:hypothetical protein [Anaerolineae bacterium]
MTHVHLLYQLQQIDDELLAARRRLQVVLQELQGSEALQRAQQRKDAAYELLQRARRKQNELELEFGSLNAKLKRSEQRLYSGEVRNPKELSDLQQEVASLTRRRGGLEDELLEAMVAAEEAEATYEQAASQLQAAEVSWQARHEALSAERDRLEGRAEQQTAARKELSARIDRASLAAYENARQRRGGIAVALLQDDLCQACGIRVSGTALRGARAGELVTCSSCGRILILH